MHTIKSIWLIGLVLCLLVGCSPASMKPAATSPATGLLTQVAQDPNAYPLAEPGAYHVGYRLYKAQDASRNDYPVNYTVWYPAGKSSSTTSNEPIKDADPDSSGAPYPLILSSTKVARIFAPYLVSHGFTWASVDGIDTYMMMNEQMIYQPLDILFVLDQAATKPPKGLKGMIDADHAGVIGYSFDGYNSLALSGARIDPAYYQAQCPTPDATTQMILKGLSAFSCLPAQAWDEFAAYAGESITTSSDGLWQPITDGRIRAVMPLAGEGWWLFGERGLAAVDRPVLMMVATQDELYEENALIFEHLGTPNKALISFIGQDHMMVYDTELVARMAHFASAFFGHRLQGHQDLAWFYSQEFVAQHAGLAWGIYK